MWDNSLFIPASSTSRCFQICSGRKTQTEDCLERCQQMCSLLISVQVNKWSRTLCSGFVLQSGGLHRGVSHLQILRRYSVMLNLAVKAKHPPEKHTQTHFYQRMKPSLWIFPLSLVSTNQGIFCCAFHKSFLLLFGPLPQIFLSLFPEQNLQKTLLSFCP